MINRPDGSFVRHRRPDQAVDVLDRLDLIFDDTHFLRYRGTLSSITPLFYNIVVLGRAFSLHFPNPGRC